MRSVTTQAVLILVLSSIAAPAIAQSAGPGRRSLSVLGGTFDSAFDPSANTAMVATRYRIGVSGLSATEFELGVGRARENGCLIAYSNDTSGGCSSDDQLLLLGGLTHGLYVPAGRLRPYAQIGVGAAVLTGYGMAGFATAGGGLAARLIGTLSGRAEVGRRFNPSGGTTYFLAGLELDVTGR